jgi:hypothetical protein
LAAFPAQSTFAGSGIQHSGSGNLHIGGNMTISKDFNIANLLDLNLIRIR